MPQLQNCLLPRIGITCVKARYKLTVGSGFPFHVILSLFCCPLLCSGSSGLGNPVGIDVMGIRRLSFLRKGGLSRVLKEHLTSGRP